MKREHVQNALHTENEQFQKRKKYKNEHVQDGPKIKKHEQFQNATKFENMGTFQITFLKRSKVVVTLHPFGRCCFRWSCFALVLCFAFDLWWCFLLPRVGWCCRSPVLLGSDAFPPPCLAWCCFSTPFLLLLVVRPSSSLPPWGDWAPSRLWTYLQSDAEKIMTKRRNNSKVIVL